LREIKKRLAKVLVHGLDMLHELAGTEHSCMIVIPKPARCGRKRDLTKRVDHRGRKWGSNKPCCAGYGVATKSPLQPDVRSLSRPSFGGPVRDDIALGNSEFLIGVGL
jgi:hypothetical protein